MPGVGGQYRFQFTDGEPLAVKDRILGFLREFRPVVRNWSVGRTFYSATFH